MRRMFLVTSIAALAAVSFSPASPSLVAQTDARTKIILPIVLNGIELGTESIATAYPTYPIATPTLSPTRTPTPLVWPTLTNTPTPAPTSTPRPADFRIGSIICEGRVELVRVDNRGDLPADAYGWIILSGFGAEEFHFPHHVHEAGASARVYSGPDAPPTRLSDFRWTLDEVWTDGADEALLINPSGEVVDARACP